MRSDAVLVKLFRFGILRYGIVNLLQSLGDECVYGDEYFHHPYWVVS